MYGMGRQILWETWDISGEGSVRQRNESLMYRVVCIVLDSFSISNQIHHSLILSHSLIMIGVKNDVMHKCV